MLTRVLIAAPRVAARQALTERLQRLDTHVTFLPPEADLWPWFAGSTCDLLLVDRELLGEDAAASIVRLRGSRKGTDVIVLHDRDEPPEHLAGYLNAGAALAIGRDVGAEPLAEALAVRLERRRGASLAAYLAEDARYDNRLEDFASDSPPMQRLLAIARRVSESNTTLLVAGETGVGKEYLLRAIHARGPRAKGPFVAVNCAALSESLLESELFGHVKGAFTGAVREHRGVFEMAHRGTLFLDEIGEMPASLQAKLLRVLQERAVVPVGGERTVPVDVRVVAATNRDLAGEVAAKRFRADLFYRLGVVTLEVPPLRERREDLPRLIESHIAHYRVALSRPVVRVHPDALAALMAYRWPGNVRELMNVIERAVLLTEGEEITLTDLPDDIARHADAHQPAAQPLATRQAGRAAGRFGRRADDRLYDATWRAARESLLEDFDRRYFERLLSGAAGRVGLAAERAGLPPRTLYDQLRRLGLEKDHFRAPRAR